MKLRQILLQLFFILISISGFSQKIKIKKGIAYVDNQAYLDLTDGDSYACTYKTMDGTEVFVAQYESYAKKNPIPRNPRSNVPYRETVTEHYAKVKFIPFELEFETESSRKWLVSKLYNDKVVDLNGAISKENAIKFQKKYGKDYSSNRPVETIIIN
ncbi:MAG: hypothetical protein MRY83_03680 [Flavobacteriales bacterium]|nr:hypothetical protein [Flavobacteriales bacterium]